MVKIELVAKQLKDEHFQNSAKSQILRYIVERPDEVFRKIELTGVFRKKIPSNTVRTLVGQLWKDGKIERHRLPDRGFSYYGTIDAIRKLRSEISGM